MSIFFSNELEDIIAGELSSARDSVQVISAFCKKEALKFICNKVSRSVTEKRLLVRYRKSDIVTGATDSDIYEICKENGWKLYVRLDLHAKTLVFDAKRALLGSANITNNGLALSGSGNCELSTMVDLDSLDQIKIQSLFSNAVCMDDELYGKMQLELMQSDGDFENVKWSKEISDILQGEVSTLFSHELPDKEDWKSYCGKQISFLELTGRYDERMVKEAFIHSNAYRWLIRILRENNSEMQFGAVSAQLHNAIITDPKPYRKEVKTYLSNMLRWIEEMKIEDIKIDRPDFSQRIRLQEGKG